MQEGFVLMFRRLGLFSFALALAVGACDDDDPVEPTVERYTAALNGANESPSVATNATGNATFTVDGNNINYTVTISNWPANTTLSAVHIHFAPVPPATTGGVMIGFPTTGPGAITTTGGSGTVTATNDQLALIRAGGTYFNVHATTTPAGTCPNHCPGGLIRGTLVRQP
jgi:CHRD domain